MLNPLNFISRFIKSSNQKELDRIDKIVQKVNSLEGEIKKIADEDFPKKTLELKKSLKENKNINDLLQEEEIIEGEQDDYCENDDFQFSI